MKETMNDERGTMNYKAKLLVLYLAAVESHFIIHRSAFIV